MSESLSIPGRFNGPLDSGNGGYCSGVVAGFIEGPAEVSLRRPVPLDTPFDVVQGDDGSVRVLPEFVWAVLDCPTYFALYMRSDLPMSVLARLTARIDAPVVSGEEHVVMAWPIGAEGRKRHAGSAVLSPDGEPLAAARALLIEPREG